MLTAGEWRDIPGFPRYQVSSAGEVYSKIARRKLSQGTSPAGYRRVLLYRGDGTRASMTVHTLVLMAFAGPRPADGMVTRHLNGDKLDNRAANLAWGTVQENIHDKFAHGTDHKTNVTHCPAGHAYDEQNTYRRPDQGVFGNRECRKCRLRHARDSHRRAAARKRAERAGSVVGA